MTGAGDGHTHNSECSSKLEVVNSSPASNRPAPSASSSSASKQFHLPELKASVTEIYSSKDDSQLRQQQQRNQSAQNNSNSSRGSLTPTSVNGLTPVMSMSTSGGASSSSNFSLLNSDEFVERLIEAVRKQPCLYNPNHEHYGNKHASAQYRAAIWQQMCQELDFSDDPHALQTQWKRIRDRYVRERRKRKLAGTDVLKNQNVNNLSAAARHFDSMRWIDEFLSETSASPATASAIGNANSDVGYYSQPPNRRRTAVAVGNNSDNNNCMEDGISLNHHTYEQNANLMRTPINRAKNESTNGSPSSTSSEISVGSAHLHNGGQAQLMYRSKDGSLHPVPAGAHPQLLSSSTPGGAGTYLVSVPASTTSQLGPNSTASAKIDQSIMTMVIGDGHGATQAYYQQQPTSNGSQKMYRLVNAVPSSSSGLIGEPLHHAEVQAPRRKRIALSNPRQSQAQLQANEGATVEGQQQQTLIIEQDRILINQPVSSSQHADQAMVVSQHQQIHLANSTNHPQHGLIAHGNRVMASTPRGIVQQQQNNGRNSSSDLLHNLPSHSQQHAAQQQQQQQQQHYILSAHAAQPQHYDPESSLVETIVRHLGNLNDDEKVVTKMNIQRILMDARFGRGACVRMFREEEQSENLAALDHQRHLQQQQQQQQQQNNNSSRR